MVDPVTPVPASLFRLLPGFHLVDLVEKVAGYAAAVQQAKAQLYEVYQIWEAHWQPRLTAPNAKQKSIKRRRATWSLPCEGANRYGLASR
jgi:hypothetical protein